MRMRLGAADDGTVVVRRGLVVVRTSQPIPFGDFRVGVGSRGRISCLNLHLLLNNRRAAAGSRVVW